MKVSSKGEKMETTTEKETKISAETEAAAQVFDNEAIQLPALREELLPYADVPGPDKEIVNGLMAEIDIRDSNSIIFFGSKAQQQVTEISDKMLEGVRNKDLGGAGNVLGEMISVLRGFDLEALDPNKKVSFWSRLFGKAKPLTKIFQRYEEVRKQVDSVTDKLETHKTTLLTDITTLDRLYGATLDYFHQLEMYITAGEEKLRQLDEETIPVQNKKAEEADDVLQAQQLRDLRARRDDLDRRVHDLRLTRQVAMQSLPAIRLVQENDKGLINKINSTLVNTVPLWRQQLATAVAIYRSGDAARAVKAATDLTNDLLESNAENLKEANAEARRQIERGVFDIESIKKANQLLIDTVEESLQIADEGKKKRAEALGQLEEMETELKKTLVAAGSGAGRQDTEKIVESTKE
jgi:uncharacterized protein YaaN involved in tellurite resistance